MGDGAIRVGWRELIDLPDWGVTRLRAKLDTGARTSSLHVDNLVELPDSRVGFDVVLHRHRRHRRIHIEAVLVRTARVKSSTGVTSVRHVVRTRLKLGEIEREIEISLVDRGAMIHRMLIGRGALAGLTVDADRRYLVTSPRQPRQPGQLRPRSRKEAAS